MVSNTRWQLLPDVRMITFHPNGKTTDWENRPGQWMVTPEGSIVIKWFDNNHWVFHPNPAMTAATSVSDKGIGMELKRVH
jgi:hypothetical protein